MDLKGIISAPFLYGPHHHKTRRKKKKKKEKEIQAENVSQIIENRRIFEETY